MERKGGGCMCAEQCTGEKRARAKSEIDMWVYSRNQDKDRDKTSTGRKKGLAAALLQQEKIDSTGTLVHLSSLIPARHARCCTQ